MMLEQVRYITDDRDFPDDEKCALFITFGGNGDWYIQVSPVNGSSPEGVRLCTSGGASHKAPGLTGAIAEAYRCIKSAENNESRAPQMEQSYSTLKEEVDAWRQNFPGIKFVDIVSGFTNQEISSTNVVRWQRYHAEQGWLEVNQDDLEHYQSKGSLIRGLVVAQPDSAGKLHCAHAIKLKRPIRMVGPDYLLIGCANCGSHDVGGSSSKVFCHSCNQERNGNSASDAILAWNNAQLEILTKNQKV